ncbi:hypothetical protein SAMN05892883_0537 [Jatrophihabitans sp. GAS493]|uniref:hypothetical protein n=1 Tax=Jatrophihabitans sp. GAS493 TaxID=1907575 RepID=UPI000BB68969|nr:hypothetical protein [Jatrophihabitans sp. GAS493]SOD70906.1 hypothetical protein SAMN05892883_0537 [Jatrophihabitans sp. GAS493]
MIESLNLATILYAVGLALWCLICAVGNRPRPPAFVAALIVLEVGVVLQALLDVAALLRGDHGDDVATNVGYLITSVLILPVTALAVRMDRGRWGSAALAVGCLLLAVVSARLLQTLGATDG